MATWVIGFFIFALGTVVGSFLNVCIYRLPQEESVIHPPSHCPQCYARLHLVDLVPLLSFLAIGRKCRSCGVPISWRYFLVEGLTGVVFLLIWWGHSLSKPFDMAAYAETAAYAAFAAALVAVIFTDLDHLIIPDELVIAALGIGVVTDLARIFWGGGHLLALSLPGLERTVHLPASLVGVVVGAAVFWGIGLFGWLLFHKESMGMGDVKLGAAIGAMLGPGPGLLSFAMAVLLGALIGLPLLVLRMHRAARQAEPEAGQVRRALAALAVTGRARLYVPFGPMIAASALAVAVRPEWFLRAAGAVWDWWKLTWTI